MPDKKLIVIGKPDYEKIKNIAKGHANIELLGYQPFSVLKDYMQEPKLLFLLRRRFWHSTRRSTSWELL
jgi:hypothetical protein